MIRSCFAREMHTPRPRLPRPRPRPRAPRPDVSRSRAFRSTRSWCEGDVCRAQAAATHAASSIFRIATNSQFARWQLCPRAQHTHRPGPNNHGVLGAAPKHAVERSDAKPESSRSCHIGTFSCHFGQVGGRTGQSQSTQQQASTHTENEGGRREGGGREEGEREALESRGWPARRRRARPRGPCAPSRTPAGRSARPTRRRTRV